MLIPNYLEGRNVSSRSRSKYVEGKKASYCFLLLAPHSSTIGIHLNKFRKFIYL